MVSIWIRRERQNSLIEDDTCKIIKEKWIVKSERQESFVICTLYLKYGGLINCPLQKDLFRI